MTPKLRALTTVMVIAIAAAERAMAQEAAEPQVVRRIVINIPALTLQLYQDGEPVRAYAIAVGKRSTPTPTGTFRIASQVKNPTWYGPKGEVVKPGRANPVGTRWIGLDKQGYGIHGTNAPNSIGRAASHGCIRMRNADAEELFTLIRVGDEVTIAYETLTADGSGLPDIYKRGTQNNGTRNAETWNSELGTWN